MWIYTFTNGTTNVHKPKKHPVKATLDAKRPFIPKKNLHSTNHPHLFMHISKLVQHCKHLQTKQIRPSNCLTITFTNKYMNTK